MLWRLGRGGDLDRTDLGFRECPLVAPRGHCRETGLGAGRPAGTKAVQVQDQEEAGAGWRRWACLAWGLSGHGQREREKAESVAICRFCFWVKGLGV